MPSSIERPARQQETLIFDQPERANTFAEHARERIAQEQAEGVDRRRDIVAEEVLKEFEQEGIGADVVRHPWEHTPAEHQEVQQLVDVAFEKDLRTALAKARTSEHYPRNLDLFHDVLTTELYQLVTHEGLNRQSTGLWALGAAIVVLAVVLVVGVLIIAL